MSYPLLRLNISSKPESPTILILESTVPVPWKITNAKDNLAYILYSSDEAGSYVSSDLDSNKILLLEKDILPNPDGYSSVAGINAQCWTDDYPPRCDNVTTISRLNEFTKALFKGELTGFTSLGDEDENEESIEIPKENLTQTKIKEIQNSNNIIKQNAENEAKEIKTNDSVEALFSE